MTEMPSAAAVGGAIVAALLAYRAMTADKWERYTSPPRLVSVEVWDGQQGAIDVTASLLERMPLVVDARQLGLDATEPFTALLRYEAAGSCYSLYLDAPFRLPLEVETQDARPVTAVSKTDRGEVCNTPHLIEAAGANGDFHRGLQGLSADNVSLHSNGETDLAESWVSLSNGSVVHTLHGSQKM